MDEATPNTWAPPSIGETHVSVVVTPPPKRRRTGLIVAVALGVAAGLAVGGFFVLRSDAGPSYALDRAATAAATTKYTSVTMSIASAGQSITLKGETDLDRGLMHFTMNMGELLGSNGNIEVIVDTKSLTIYMASAVFKTAGAPIDTPWVKVDQKTLEAAGQDASAFDQIDIGNQLAPASLFATAKSVKDIGLETIDGEHLEHYEVTLDMQKVLELNPLLKSTADSQGTTLPDEITYQAYITKDNEIRRLTYTFGEGDAAAEATIVSHVLPTAPAIDLPADADVTDLATFL